MMFLRKPNANQIHSFLDTQSKLDFTYSFVGDTAVESAPDGYTVDRNQIHLGTGPETFQIAKRALSCWQHFGLNWIELHPPNASVAPGQTVGVLAGTMGIHVLSACRVVYVIEEESPRRRFAFGYGTLPDHPETGEERFQVEHRADDSVWFDILAYSKPRQLLARFAYPYVRFMQKQFARGSMAAMSAAIEESLARTNA